MSADRRDDPPLRVGPHSFRSRLILGTGKYPSYEIMRECHRASGTELVTVAVRRIPEGEPPGRRFLDFLERERLALLPNTAGCYDVDSALRTARLGRELLGTDLVKVEVLGDPKTLLPDPLGTLRATEQLVKEGFLALVYCSDDVILARRLEEAGATCVMPAGSPIGSGQGVLNPQNIALIVESAKVPVIVDAGVGTASDVALTMELGAHGVLLNTAVAQAADPVRMARAMQAACAAGRDAYLAGRIPKRRYASASSPETGLIAGAGAPSGV
ncbi:MAG: thiazole synthase [Planctomycetota bacterium]|nr:MAG: thiazole synthase [Planctomycetota bacterium]